MKPINGVVPDVFDFIDELAMQVSLGDIEPDDAVELDSKSIEFCESFFVQYFAGMGYSIVGFGRRSKENASWLAEHLRDTAHASSVLQRRLVSLFEEFCDLRRDVVSEGYGGGGSPDHEALHRDYLVRLLKAIVSWSAVEGGPVAQRAEASARRYESAVEESAWLTKKRRNGFGWLRRTLRRRTSS